MSIYYKIGTTFYRSEQKGKQEARAQLDKGKTLACMKCVTTLKGKDLEIAILNGQTPWVEEPCGIVKGKKTRPTDSTWSLETAIDEDTEWTYRKGVPVPVAKGSIPASEVITW